MLWRARPCEVTCWNELKMRERICSQGGKESYFGLRNSRTSKKQFTSARTKRRTAISRLGFEESLWQNMILMSYESQGRALLSSSALSSFKVPTQGDFRIKPLLKRTADSFPLVFTSYAIFTTEGNYFMAAITFLACETCLKGSADRLLSTYPSLFSW